MYDLELLILEEILKAQLEGFPKLISAGETQNVHYFITNRFKMSLQDIMNKRRKIFTKKTVYQIGIEITTLLEKLHNLGYVYNDLKPDNICVGNFKENGEDEQLHQINLIDFGLCRKYRTESGSHLLEGRQAFSGNLAYASHHALKGITRSRRDDILSLFILLNYLLTGNLLGAKK